MHGIKQELLEQEEACWERFCTIEASSPRMIDNMLLVGADCKGRLYFVSGIGQQYHLSDEDSLSGIDYIKENVRNIKECTIDKEDFLDQFRAMSQLCHDKVLLGFSIFAHIEDSKSVCDLAVFTNEFDSSILG